MKQIDLKHLEGKLTYPEFVQEMEEIVIQGTEHPIDYSESLVEYTKLNLSRKQRWDRKLKLDQYTPIWANLKSQRSLIIISEGWCGDAAHVVPVMAHLAEKSEQITVEMIHRDHHLDIMDAFLTNGGRSIPKAILVDDAGVVLGSWGPRPSELQELFLAERAKGAMSPEDIKIFIQKWYNKDKGQTTAKELTAWISKLDG